MPHKTFWDKSDGATVRRAQWVIDNEPTISTEEIAIFMALQPDALASLLPRVTTAMLGKQLTSAYQVYCDITSRIPADKTTQVPYYEGVVKDRLKEIHKKYEPNSEQWLEAVEEAPFATVTVQKRALFSAGVSGSVVDLFEMVYEHREVINPLTQSYLVPDIEMHREVPKEHRLSAHVREDGYYYGGQFTAFAEQFPFLVDRVLDSLNVNPEYLFEPPTNQDLIESNSGLTEKQLTRPVRSGFLQMWQYGQVKEAISELAIPQLKQLKKESQKKIDSRNTSEREKIKLRFILQSASTALTRKK